MNFFKLIMAAISMLVVSLIILIPMGCVAAGTYFILNNIMSWGLILLAIGLAIFWLVKPFSIIFNKDFKIF